MPKGYVVVRVADQNREIRFWSYPAELGNESIQGAGWAKLVARAAVRGIELLHPSKLDASAGWPLVARVYTSTSPEGLEKEGSSLFRLQARPLASVKNLVATSAPSR